MTVGRYAFRSLRVLKLGTLLTRLKFLVLPAKQSRSTRLLIRGLFMTAFVTTAPLLVDVARIATHLNLGVLVVTFLMLQLCAKVRQVKCRLTLPPW